MGRGREGGRGGMTVIHILMAPQYLNSNHIMNYVILFQSTLSLTSGNNNYYLVFSYWNGHNLFVHQLLGVDL